jgi:hypothetical protein
MIVTAGNFIGGILSGAMKIGGAIFGGISAARAAKKMENSIKQQQRENQAWYDQRYNEDATQRADAQRALAMTMDAIRDRSMDAKGSAAVMGGTEESLAATKAANAQALADTAAGIAVAGAARKDQIENQYMQKKDALNEKLQQVQQQKAQAISNAIGGASEGASGLMGMLG